MDRQTASFRTKQAKLVYKMLTILAEATKEASTEVRTVALTLIANRRELCTMIDTDAKLRRIVDKLVEAAKKGI